MFFKKQSLLTTIPPDDNKFMKEPSDDLSWLYIIIGAVGGCCCCLLFITLIVCVLRANNKSNDNTDNRTEQYGTPMNAMDNGAGFGGSMDSARAPSEAASVGVYTSSTIPMYQAVPKNNAGALDSDTTNYQNLELAPADDHYTAMSMNH